jgi:hypothetical protein
MNELDDTTRPRAELTAPRRNRFYYAKMMDVLHFEMEQRYGQEMRWLGNRLAVGSGVLCGLEVSATDGALWVGPGAAIDPLGREILVPVATSVDPSRLGNPALEPGQVYTLSVCYRECVTDHAPVLVGDCGTRESCAAGTVVETFRFELRPGTPDRPPGLCARCGDKLFPRDPGAGEITGVDLSVVGTFTVDGAPVAAAASPDGRVVALLVEQERPVLYVADADTLAAEVLALTELTSPVGGLSFAPDGGPALLTSATGVAVVNVSRARPKLVASFLADKDYGRCAAARGGKLLFAIDRRSGNVDCIDVAAGTVRQTLDARGDARDLAVSGDGRWLHVTCEPDQRVLRFRVSDLALWRDLGGFARPDPLAASLAVRSRGQSWEPWVARGSELRVVRASGARELTLADVSARDHAFTSDGALLAVLSSLGAPGALVDELVVLGADRIEELARIRIGAVPSSVVVVPGRLRAVVTHPQLRTLTVVDGQVTRGDAEPFDRRRALCRCTAGPCTPPVETCVPLAAIGVGEDGRIARVDPCAVRRRLYSNEMLLDLILCLAERLDECCRRSPAPDPEPDPGTPDPNGLDGERP